MSKEFLTYNRQMKYLRDHKNIICSGTCDKVLLVSSGYFNLVNGYKAPFSIGKDQNGNHIYLPGTTLQEMYALKQFDDELRILLFKYITIVEQEVRALSAYTFDNINHLKALTWYSVNAYNTQKTTKVVSIISKIYYDLSRSKHQYVKNYLENHNAIPTWIMVKVISFSNLIDFIDLNKPIIKDNLCEMYSIKTDRRNDYKLLIGSLQWFRVIRNSCAHNERVFEIKLPNERILTPYFDLMAPRAC